MRAEEAKAMREVVRHARRVLEAVMRWSDGSWKWTDCKRGAPDADMWRALRRLDRARAKQRSQCRRYRGRVAGGGAR
jgi:hypothetical protein